MKLSPEQFTKKYGKNFKIVPNNNKFVDILKGINDKLRQLLNKETKFPTAIKILNPTTRVEISNPVREVEIKDEIKIKKPNWYKEYEDKKLIKVLDKFSSDILRAIKNISFDKTDILDAIENINLDKYQSGKQALAVKLTTEEGLHYASTGALGATNQRVEDKLDSLITLQTASSAAAGQAKMTPTMANVAMATADTEYSYTLPDNTKGFHLKLRAQNALLQLAFTSGASGTTYLTLAQNDRFDSFEYNMDLDNKTIYFRSPNANQTAEIIVFT